MTSRLNPYLVFDGNAREAMTFYQSVFGGELKLMTFGELMASGNAAVDERIMHGQLESPSGYVLMGADIPTDMTAPPYTNAVSMCLNGDDEAELRGYWDKLAEGASIGMNLEQQMWGDIYGDLVDRFGVHWSVDIG